MSCSDSRLIDSFGGPSALVHLARAQMIVRLALAAGGHAHARFRTQRRGTTAACAVGCLACLGAASLFRRRRRPRSVRYGMEVSFNRYGTLSRRARSKAFGEPKRPLQRYEHRRGLRICTRVNLRFMFGRHSNKTHERKTFSVLTAHDWPCAWSFQFSVKYSLHVIVFRGVCAPETGRRRMSHSGKSRSSACMNNRSPH